jgi:acyl carrier protein
MVRGLQMPDLGTKDERSVLMELVPIFKEVFGKEAIVISADTTAKDVEGWDSLAHMKLILAIEEHFAIRFKLREIVRFKKVGDVCRAILNPAK